MLPTHWTIAGTLLAEVTSKDMEIEK